VAKVPPVRKPGEPDRPRGAVRDEQPFAAFERGREIPREGGFAAAITLHQGQTGERTGEAGDIVAAQGANAHFSISRRTESAAA